MTTAIQVTQSMVIDNGGIDFGPNGWEVRRNSRGQHLSRYYCACGARGRWLKDAEAIEVAYDNHRYGNGGASRCR